LASKQIAAVLTIIGGVFYLFGSVLGSVITALLSSLASLSGGFSLVNVSNPSELSSLDIASSAALGVLAFGLFCGILIIVGGALINSDNAGRRKSGGILALAMMFIGGIPDIGGLLIGFFLTLVGGVLGLTYKANEPDISVGMMQGSSAPVASPQPSPMNRPPGGYCIKCGKQLHEGAVFCKYCGSPVPQ
jgi:hypothetical protein